MSRIDAPPPGQVTIAAPQRMRAAETRPSSYQEDDNSLEVVWSTGAQVTRFDWWDWEYYSEELSMEASAVRLERLNSGAAVLDTHNSHELSAVIGSIVPGSVRIENGMGIARVALAQTDDVRDIVAKIVAGHIRNISVGYIVHQYTRIEREGERTIMRADDWEPTEISFVPVPADAGAQVRSGQPNAEQGGFPCIIRGIAAAPRTETDMNTPNQGAPEGDRGARDQQQTPAPAPVQTATPPAPEQRSEPAAVTARRIRDVVSRSNLGADFALELVARNEENPLTEAALTDAIAERIEAQRNTTPINANRVGDRGIDNAAYRSAIENAITLRSGGTVDLTDEERRAARDFTGMSLIELARFHIEQEGISTRGMDRMTLAGVALGIRAGGAHTTSDFAQILANTANRQLRRAYEAMPQTFRPFTIAGTLPDFKPAPLVGLGDAPALLLTGENGEFKYGSMSDFGDTYRLATYGRIIAITRQTIINDDLNVFSRVPSGFGAQAAQLESDLVYAQLLSNPTMYDGNALFSTQHVNLAGTGTAITEAALAAAEQAMMTQTSPEGTQLNLLPRFLIVGPAKKVEAQKMLSAVVPNATSSVNVFANSYELIVEGRITGNQWFLAADPALIDTVRLDSLEGQDGVYTETRVGFEVDGVEMKARVDRVAKVMDWRGFYRNPGN